MLRSSFTDLATAWVEIFPIPFCAICFVVSAPIAPTLADNAEFVALLTKDFPNTSLYKVVPMSFNCPGKLNDLTAVDNADGSMLLLNVFISPEMSSPGVF